MPPWKILNLDPLKLQSGTRLLFNTCNKTIVTILASQSCYQSSFKMHVTLEIAPLASARIISTCILALRVLAVATL